MPTIDGETNYKVVEGSTLDYKKMKAQDKIDGELEVIYEGEVDFNKVGTYKVNAKATDKNNNEVTKEITIVVEAKPVKPTPSKNTNTTTKSNTSKNTNTNTKPNTKPTKPNTSGSTGGTTEYPYYKTLTLRSYKLSTALDQYMYYWGYQDTRWYTYVSALGGKCGVEIGWQDTKAPQKIVEESLQRTQEFRNNGCKVK